MVINSLSQSHCIQCNFNFTIRQFAIKLLQINEEEETYMNNFIG